MRKRRKHAGGQIYEIEKTHSTHTQASKARENIVKYLLKKIFKDPSGPVAQYYTAYTARGRYNSGSRPRVK
jgi:hypothetical protein